MWWSEIKEILRECEVKDVLAIFVGLPLVCLLYGFILLCIREVTG